MKLSQTLAAVVLVLVCMQAAEAKKKNRKQLSQAPQWKTNSDPGKDERYKSENEGKTVKLDCRAKGKPSPKVTWFKDGQRLTKDSPGVEIKKYKLTLTSLVMEDKGNYTCVVNNNEGRLEWTFLVDVVVRIWPLIVEGPDNITADVGATVTFRCVVVNDPEATIRWLKPKRLSAFDSANTVGSSAFVGKPEFLENFGNPELLVLENVQPEDAGEYRCMAGNVWGLKYSSAYLTIEQPSTTTESATTTTPTTTTKRTTPSWFFPQTTYADPYVPVFGLDLYPTTRAPRKGKKNKNGRRRRPPKNRHTTTTTTTYSPPSSKDPVTTIWNFDDRLGREDTGMTFNEPAPEDNMEGDYADAGLQEGDQESGWISLWTIYTIVGAVAGVILLVGLLAITIAVCCRRDSGSVYKSTPV